MISLDMLNLSEQPLCIFTRTLMQRENASARWTFLFCLNFCMFTNFTWCLSTLDLGNLTTEAEGNCLRFYLLQKVSRNAMRALLDRESGTFAATWNVYQTFCKEKKGKMLEGNYYHYIWVIIYFDYLYSWVGCILSFLQKKK